jgi:predicted DNA-binding protein
VSDDVKDEKKRRVIHTRVSAEMEEELKERAAALGLSVSNLIRHVLGNTLGLVEDIVADAGSVARSARGESRVQPPNAGGTAKPAPAPEPEPEVIAWQPAVLNLNAVCARCNAILARGSDAAVAVTSRPGPRPILCPSCLEEHRHDSTSAA